MLNEEQKFMPAILLRVTLLESEATLSAWKECNFCWYLQFSWWKGECQVQEVIKVLLDTLFTTFIGAVHIFLHGNKLHKLI